MDFVDRFCDAFSTLVELPQVEIFIGKRLLLPGRPEDDFKEKGGESD